MFEQVYQFIFEQIGKNDLVAGGAVLGALAFLLNYLKRVPFTLMYWSRLAFITEIDIPDKTDAFNWVTDWVSQNSYSKRAKRVTVESHTGKKMRKGAYPPSAEGNGGEVTSASKAKISPAPGTHWVWWKRRLIILRRVRNEGTGDNAHRMYRESWALSMLGRRKHVESFIEECRSISEKDKDSKIKVLENDRGYWQKSSSRRKRPLSSVILPSGMSTELITDINEFIQSEDWYHEMNIPWRRGYLLTGPPGNGKSSIITAVASEINFEVCIAGLRNLQEDDLICLMAEVSEGSIILLEDIDCIFDQRTSEEGVQVGLSTVLNLLDGVNAGEGRLVFMTTNSPEKLDPALVRPGRVDLTLHLPNATNCQAAKLYERFFPDCKNSEDFGARVGKMDVSMAKLQGYLLRHRRSTRDARTNIEELKDD